MNSLFTPFTAALVNKSILMEINRLIKAICRSIELQEMMISKIDQVFDHLSAFSKNTEVPNDLIDGVEVRSILNIGRSTLYRLKKSKEVQVKKKIGRREYYSRAELTSVSTKMSKRG